MTDVRCANPKCRMELQRPKAVDLGEAAPTFDDIVVCGGCCSINVISLSGDGARLMTEKEFDELSPEEKGDLDYVMRMIRKHGHS